MGAEKQKKDAGEQMEELAKSVKQTQEGLEKLCQVMLNMQESQAETKALVQQLLEEKNVSRGSGLSSLRHTLTNPMDSFRLGNSSSSSMLTTQV